MNRFWIRRALPVCLLAVILAAGAADAPGAAALRPEVAEFVTRVADRHGFDKAELTRMFAQVKFEPRIVELITKPAEGKPWTEYRPIFINAERIGGGVSFHDSNAETLARAEATYGVAEEVVTAIIGVETRYGARTGGFRVLDALSTLAFDYPRRARFFSAELENFLVLTRENRLDPLQLQGSYAGAIGIPQFMPSSYRTYAVDFDGDGRADLLGSTQDAIGSVANYLRENGWRPGAPVAIPVQVSGEAAGAASRGKPKQRLAVAEWKARGVQPQEAVDDSLKAGLLELETAEGKEYWLVFDNFYAVTRYNNSVFYAMAVTQLAREVRALRGEGAAAR